MCRKISIISAPKKPFLRLIISYERNFVDIFYFLSIIIDNRNRKAINRKGKRYSKENVYFMVNNKTVVVLYNSLSEDASKDVADVILQADAVCDALEKYRCNIFRYAFCGDFGALSEYIEKIKPDFIFNLVEEVSGKGRLGYIIPAYLESKGNSVYGEFRGSDDFIHG
jgi:hypothetical protein